MSQSEASISARFSSAITFRVERNSVSISDSFVKSESRCRMPVVPERNGFAKASRSSKVRTPDVSRKSQASASSVSDANNASWNNCRLSFSSSTRKPGAMALSTGKSCSRRSQKPWMVCIFNPPGVSSARVNKVRARLRIWGSALLPLKRQISSSRSASLSPTQVLKRWNSRLAISAAAAFV